MKSMRPPLVASFFMTYFYTFGILQIRYWIAVNIKRFMMYMQSTSFERNVRYSKETIVSVSFSSYQETVFLSVTSSKICKILHCTTRVIENIVKI